MTDGTSHSPENTENQPVQIRFQDRLRQLVNNPDIQLTSPAEGEDPNITALRQDIATARKGTKEQQLGVINSVMESAREGGDYQEGLGVLAKLAIQPKSEHKS